MSRDQHGPFDDVLEVEEKMKISGFESGYPRGRSQGMADGFATGFSQGTQLAKEVGYCLGFAEYTLDNVCPVSGEALTAPKERARKVLLQVVELISEFQCLDVSSPGYPEHLTKIRTKFKQALSLLKVDTHKLSQKTLDF